MDTSWIDQLQVFVAQITQANSNSPEFNLGMLIEKISRLIEAYKVEVQKNADLAAQLATALSNDVADAQAIADAQAAATEAQAKSDSLQGLVDADIAEDAQIESAIDAVLPPV